MPVLTEDLVTPIIPQDFTPKQNVRSLRRRFDKTKTNSRSEKVAHTSAKINQIIRDDVTLKLKSTKKSLNCREQTKV